MWTAAVFAILAGAGFGYETVARGGDADRHPPRGRLIDVGGHRLHLYCTGTGGPTVILEAGLGESSASWADVQSRIAARTRVCSYDRAGYAWSEEGPGPRTADREARELHTLLDAAGEAGPYVLVGHSYGGAVVRVFAHHWSDQTAGLVLVDSMDESGVGELRVARPLVAAQFTAYELAGRFGLLRLLGGSAAAPPDAPEIAVRDAAVVYGPASMAAARAEGWSTVDSAAQVAATVRAGAWRDLPVVVIVAKGQPEEVVAHHRGLAAMSARGRLVVAGTAEHYVQYAQPDLVVDAVSEVASSADRG